MPWSKVEVEDGVLALWPGLEVRKRDVPVRVHAFFKKMFDIEVIPVGCVETLSVTNDSGEEIEGGRCDFFFYIIQMEDVQKFALERFKFGIKWWEDVFFNHGESIYPPEFLEAYPNPVR